VTATGDARAKPTAKPPPRASFFLAATELSVYDDVRAYDASFDPGGAGIEAHRWDFGDGGAGIGRRVTHRYDADGDYVVSLAVTTLDGRQASAEQRVRVRTHDVAITAFTVPRRARAGEPTAVTVRLAGGRYAEAVRVELLKGVPGGAFETIASDAIEVEAGATLDVRFRVELGAADAAAGRVFFKAVAMIVGARDASPADNVALALPTVVRS
jgi:hypothetical protein